MSPSSSTTKQSARTIPGAALELMEPMLAAVGERAVPGAPSLETQAQMSRRRFAITQFTSIFGGLIFLLAVGCYSLTKIEGLSKILTNSCETSNSSAPLCKLVALMAIVADGNGNGNGNGNGIEHNQTAEFLL